jgi:hypothetical protein
VFNDDKAPVKMNPQLRAPHTLNRTSTYYHSQKDALDRLKKVLYQNKKLIVIAGTGISISAGSK